MRKILFLDVDGVLNSEETMMRATKRGGQIGIDPYLTLLVHRIIEATKCEVVLSSSWRHGERNRETVMAAVPFIDYTGNYCAGIRGCEIYSWILKNIEPDWRENIRYAILDDDSDMLLWQKDSFFQTTWKKGLTEEIVEKVITHLNAK